MHRFALAFALVAATTAVSSSAFAQEPPPQERSAALARTLEAFSAKARGERIANALGQGAVGAATIVPGVVLMGRNDPTLQLVGTSLVVVGAVQVLSISSLLLSTPIEQIDGRYQAGLARGEDPASLTRRIENELRDAAERRRTSRVAYGVVAIVIGVAAVTTGLVFLVQPPGILGMDQQTQYVWGSVLTGAGGSFVVGGLREAFVPTPEETAWAAYGGPTPPRTAAGSLRVMPVIAPAYRGATGGLQLTF
jgi:hypothetical protein